MRKICLMLLALSLTVSSLACNNGKRIYKRYSDAQGVNAVYVSPSIFRFLGKLPDFEYNGESVNFAKLVNSFKGFCFLKSTDSTVSGDIGTDVSKLVKSRRFEPLMEFKEDGEAFQVFTVGKGDIIKSLILFAKHPDYCTYISLDGRLSRTKLEELFDKLKAEEGREE